MSFLDSLLNGLGQDAPEKNGGAAAGGLADLIRDQGGLGGLITKLGQSGLSDAAASWIGKGANQSISADQIAQVLGSGPIAQFAERLGISPAQASQVLAQVLPQLIDRVTPGDTLTEAANPLDEVLGNLPGGLGGVLGGLFKR